MPNNANTVSIISGGTTYYFWDGTGTQTAYTGANSPWTSAGTSCYILALNSTAGPIWVPTPAHANVIYSGGPPFSIGRRPAYQGYDNITEPIGVQMKATTKDNAIFLLRQLRKILNPIATPAILTVKGGTNPGYCNIHRADIDESSLYLEEPTGQWRATMTWTRYPFFGLINGGEILINAVTINNTGTGSPDNVEAYSAGAGDLIYEGSPLGVSLTPTAGKFGMVYLATIASRVYSTTGAAAYSTSSTTGTTAYNINQDVSACLTDHRLQPRVIMRVSTASANVQARMKAKYGASLLFTGAWVSPLAASVATLFDLGTYPVDLIRQQLKGITAPVAQLIIDLRSTDGSSANFTTTYTELLLCHTYTAITGASGATTTKPMLISQFPEQTGAAALPHQVPSVVCVNGTDIDAVHSYRGTLPLYVSGSSLYAAWTDGNQTHTTTDTATLTATHAPLWATVRGAT